MDFEKKAPEWKATGTEPPESLKESGFQAGYKPPAAIFNWFWNCVSSCLKELQEKVKMIRAVEDGGTGRSTVTSGSYLVGNGTGALNEKTPEQVREHIGAAKKNEAIPVVPAASADGIAYTATVEGVTELYNGMLLTIIPDVVSASNTITLNINDLGAKMVRLPLSFNNAAMTTPRLETYFTAGRPITLQYDAGYLAGDGIWKTFGKQRSSAQDLYGTVPVESGGTGAETAADALENLGALPVDGTAVSAKKLTGANFGITEYITEIEVADFNDLSVSGLFQCAGDVANAPHKNPCFVLSVCSSNERRTQFSWRSKTISAEKIVYMRRYLDGEWDAWEIVAKQGVAAKTTVSVSLPVSGWDSNLQQTVSVSGVTTDSSVIVSADPSTHEAYHNCMVRCSEQGKGTLTFTASEKPTAAVKANVLILN